MLRLRHLAVTHLVDKSGRIVISQDVVRRMVSTVIRWLKRDGNFD
jgi:hypothetical protein